MEYKEPIKAALSLQALGDENNKQTKNPSKMSDGNCCRLSNNLCKMKGKKELLLVFMEF
jgi:hypothetical protein